MSVPRAEPSGPGASADGRLGGTHQSVPGAGLRIGYAILSYRDPEQIERLASRLTGDDPAGRVLVLHDPFASPTSRRPDAGDRARVEVVDVDRARCWGSFELTSSMLDAMAWALRRAGCDWLVLLSGQDYPARPLSDLHEHLAGRRANAHLTIEALGDGRGWRRSRDVGAELYRYRYVPGPPTSRRPFSRMGYLQGTARWQPFVSVRVNPREHRMLLGWRSRRAPFSPTFVPVKGRDWFALDRMALEAVLGFVASRPDYVEHYRRAFISSESFFHTIICNDPALRVHPSGLHYERWNPDKPSPDVLVRADLADIVASRAFFVRKVDPASAALLDALDVHGSPSPAAPAPTPTVRGRSADRE